MPYNLSYSHKIRPISIWISLDTITVFIIVILSVFAVPIDFSPDGMEVSSSGDRSIIAYKSASARNGGIGIDLGPNQTSYGRFGEVIEYQIKLVNNQTVSDYIDITSQSNPGHWSVMLFLIDGISILRDSPGDGDGIPDTGLLDPQDIFEFVVKVTVPLNQPFNEPEVTIITASSSKSPEPHTASCKLVTKAFPYLDATKSVTPVQIYEENAQTLGLDLPTHARVTLNIKGGGIPEVLEKYHDVVFLIDNTGSMNTSDPTKIRLQAANSYVDNMSLPDKGAVVTFYGTQSTYPRGYAWLARGPNSAEEHLSNNYIRIKDNINWSGQKVQGGTNILRALEIGNDELINNGDPEHVWYIILLTDGGDSGNLWPGDRDGAIRTEAQRAANNNIVVFTIGLGSSTNVQLLKDIASLTEGEYYTAQNAEDLMKIYNQIHYVVSNVAGQDPNPADDNSMVREVLPNYINLVPGSFRLEEGSMEVDPNPSRLEHLYSNTTIHWNVEEILINQSWLVSFEITATKLGWIPVGVYPDSRVHYTDWTQDEDTYLAFPEVWIEVLPVPRPDVIPINASINDVLFDPQNIIQVERGEEISISAKIKNQGLLGTGQFNDVFHIGIYNATIPGKPFFLSDVEPLDIEKTSPEFRTKWQAPFTLGSFVLSIVVDWYNNLPEGAEGEQNNVFNLTVTVVHNPIIDLIPINLMVDREILSEPALTTIEVDTLQELKIELQVKNVGNENTNYFASEFFIAIYNRTTPEYTLDEQVVYSLSASSNSRSLVFLWQAPNEPGIVELEIDVDATDAIPETGKGELNNKVQLKINVNKKVYIDLMPHSLSINDEQKSLSDISPYEPLQKTHELVVGQLATINFQIVTDANEPTSYFGPEFQVVLFNLTDSEGIYFLRINIKNLEPNEASDMFTAKWRAPLSSGVYSILLSIDHFNAISEDNNGEKNNLINILLTVHDLPEAPEPDLEIDRENSDVLLSWNAISGAVEYQVYGALAPNTFDFTKTLAVTTDTTWLHISAISFFQQFYYCIRASDERGWTGASGPIVGFFTSQFTRGYNTFSIPLEPFEYHTADWYADEMFTMDFETIFFYDDNYGQWIGHPKFLPAGIDDIELYEGECYLMHTAQDFDYTFIGRPETIIRFVQGTPDDQWLGGNTSDDSFRIGLKLNVQKTGVLLEWPLVSSSDNPDERLKYYEIYRQTKRGGLDFSKAGQSEDEFAELELIATTRLTKYSDNEISKLIELRKDSGTADNLTNEFEFGGNQNYFEFHYIIVPVNEHGRRGSSTYSQSVSITELKNGYNFLSFTLVCSPRPFVYDYISDVGASDSDTLFYFNRFYQHWIGHPYFLPDFRDNPEMKMGEGYIIFILTDTNRFHYQTT